MSSTREPLIVQSERGLYCPPGDFYIDPTRPVQTAVITHAHADHLRHGSARYILARPGAGVAGHRLGAGHDIATLEYGERVKFGAATVSLHSAGHILGSAQVRIEHGDEVWVVSGDYKRQADPTCAAFEPLECDVFVSEATFAQPVYRWPDTTQVVEKIVAWWRGNRERGVASVLFCYALGKAQRVLAELRAFTDEPVYLHGSVDSLTAVYRRAGVEMVPTLTAVTERGDVYRGALIIAPPNAARTPWVRRFGEHSTGFCSGWMLADSGRPTRRYDRGFAISDHADWPALVDTCIQTKARRVRLMHGRYGELVRHLNDRGMDAAEI